MPNTTKELTPRQRLNAIAILLLIASIAGQVFLLFFFPNQTYDPGEGNVINFAAVVFQICAMLAAVGLMIIGTLLLLALHLVKPLAGSGAAAALPPIK